MAMLDRQPRVRAGLLAVLAFGCMFHVLRTADAWSVIDAARAPLATYVTPWSMLHKCRLRPQPAEFLRTILASKFVGQTEALNAVVDAVKAWDEE
jgi:hypothetical protein